MSQLPDNPLPSFRKRNPHLYPPTSEGDQELARASKRIRQDSKPLMNKLEMDLFRLLQADPKITCLRPQAMRYKLGNGIWYKPDFTARLNYGYGFFDAAFEVKGPHAFRGGFENLKVAAHEFIEIKWFLYWRKDGEWNWQEILP